MAKKYIIHGKLGTCSRRLRRDSVVLQKRKVRYSFGMVKWGGRREGQGKRYLGEHRI